MVPSPATPQPFCPGLQASELWEVVEEPRGQLGAERIMPERQEGHLLKKRKWPLKGWHKVGWAGQREGPDAGRLVVVGLLGSMGCFCIKKKRLCGCSLPFLLASRVLFPSGKHHRDTLCSRMESFTMQRLGKM